jgi:hypothetical protein
MNGCLHAERRRTRSPDQLENEAFRFGVTPV